MTPIIAWSSDAISVLPASIADLKVVKCTFPLPLPLPLATEEAADELDVED